MEIISTLTSDDELFDIVFIDGHQICEVAVCNLTLLRGEGKEGQDSHLAHVRFVVQT